MSFATVHGWIIAYDIADNRRRARVHKAVKDFAIPVQYSLYLTFATHPQIRQFSCTLAPLISPTLDDIRIYRVPDDPEFYILGNQRTILNLSPSAKIPPGLRHFVHCLTTGSRDHRASSVARRTTPFCLQSPSSEDLLKSLARKSRKE